jgi:hypothetical protein
MPSADKVPTACSLFKARYNQLLALSDASGRGPRNRFHQLAKPAGNTRLIPLPSK